MRSCHTPKFVLPFFISSGPWFISSAYSHALNIHHKTFIYNCIFQNNIIDSKGFLLFKIHGTKLWFARLWSLCFMLTSWIVGTTNWWWIFILDLNLCETLILDLDILIMLITSWIVDLEDILQGWFWSTKVNDGRLTFWLVILCWDLTWLVACLLIWFKIWHSNSFKIHN